MDDFERRVLRRRKDVLAQNITVDEELLRLLKKASLLTTDMIVIIGNEKTNDLRINKMIDFLCGCQRANSFEEFCNAVQVCGENSWLAKELQIEVKTDKGNLIIDDDVMKQSAMLVHRKFGASKRFSEIDKKDMTELIAVKIQMSKEEWGKELEAVREELRQRNEAIKSRDNRIRKLRNDLVTFIKDHDRELVSKALGLKTTSDILKQSIPDDDLFSIMEENQTYLLQRAHLALKERGLIMDERARVERFLGVNLENDGTLDAIIKEKMNAAQEQVDRFKQQSATKEQKIERLRTQMIQMERQLEIHEEDKKEETTTEAKTEEREEINEVNSRPVENNHCPDESNRNSGSASSANSGIHPKIDAPSKTVRKTIPRKKSAINRTGVHRQRPTTRS